MEIIYYKMLSPVNALDRVLTQITTGDIVAKDALETLTPIITVSHNETVKNECNYAYIPDRGRWYFVNERVGMTGSRLQMYLRTDVLYTFGAQIRGNSGIVQRQQYLNNAYYQDSELPIYAYNNVLTRKFPQGFSETNNVVLVACGGK